MARLFSEQGHTQHTRAVQVWQVLINAARQRQTLTYRGLSRSMGFNGPRAAASFLASVGLYCNVEGLPDLTSIVVNERTGVPNNWRLEAGLAAEHERVFQYNWLDVVPPTTDDFAETMG